MAPLPSFGVTVTGGIGDIRGGVEGGELVSVPLTGLRIEFVPNVDPDDFVTWDGGLHRIHSVTGVVAPDGAILHDGEPVLLVADHEDLGVDNLQWQVNVHKGQTLLNSWTIPAQADNTVVDLSDLAPVIGTDAVGVLQGPRGAQGPPGPTGPVGPPSVDIATATHAAPNKATLADADEFPIVDSEASNVLKNIKWSDIAAAVENLIGNYETETLALINRMTVRPNLDHRAAIDTLISTLKVAGIWAKLDGLHLLAAHTQQAALLNWVSTARDLTAFNSPTFTADRGIAGDGATSYLGMSAAFTGSSLLQMVNNSESLGVWTRINQAIDSVYGASLGTSATGTSTDRYVNPRAASTAVVWRADTATQTSPTHATSDRTLVAWSHNATDAYLYFNGAQDDTFTGAFTNNPSTLSLFLTMGRAGTVYSTRQYGGVFYGGYLTATEHAVLYNAMFDYMTALGAI